MSAKLDEIAERLGHSPMGPNTPMWCEACSFGGWVPWPCPFRAALTEAYDLGRGERDKELPAPPPRSADAGRSSRGGAVPTSGHQQRAPSPRSPAATG